MLRVGNHGLLVMILRHIKNSVYRPIVRALCLAAVLALVCFVATISLRHPAPPMTTANAADADTALLERVNAEVSQTVPTSLAPLAGVVSWEKSDQAATTVNR